MAMDRDAIFDEEYDVIGGATARTRGVADANQPELLSELRPMADEPCEAEEETRADGNGGERFVLVDHHKLDAEFATSQKMPT